MAVADRRARDKESLRQKILDTARELFVAHGYEGVTLRKIGNAIEYAPGTIYSHFKDKHELIRALCSADWEAFGQSFPRDRQADDPIQGLKAIGASYIRFALSHPNHYRLMFMTPPAVAPHPTVLETRSDPARNGYALLMQTVRRAIEADMLRDEYRDAELVAQTLWAGVHGMASLHIAMGPNDWIAWTPVEKRIGATLDALLFGIARNPPRSTGANA